MLSMQMRTEMKARLRQARDWGLAIDELEREAEQVASEQERARLLFELGALSEEVVPERERALSMYQRAWKLHPIDLQPLTRARLLYQELGRTEMVAKVGEIELQSVSSGPEVGALAAVVGEALLDSGQRDRAVSVLQMALEACPDSTRVRDALAAADYDPEGWFDDVERLREEASRAEPQTGARMLLRAARIVRQETPDHALYEELLAHTLRIDPLNEAARSLYENLLASKQRWDELEEHHERWAQAAPNPAERAQLYRRFALEWVQRFRDRERAARMFVKAIRASTGDKGGTQLRSLVAGFALLHETYGQRADWQAVLEVADGILDHLDEESRLYVASQCAQIAWKQLADTGRARRYFDVVRAIDPASSALSEFAAATTSAAVPVNSVSPTEERPVNTVQDDKTAGQQPLQMSGTEAGDRRRGAPGETGGPPVAESVPEEIGADLQAAMDEARQAEGGSPEAATEAWRAVITRFPGKRAPRRQLARVLRGAERWNALIEALKEELTLVPRSGAEAIALLREMVEIYRDKLRLDVMVVNTLNQIVEVDPANLEALDELVEKYTAMKRWPDLVATLGKKAEATEDRGLRAGLYLQIASLYVERFSNQAEAIKAYEKVLDIQPDNPEASQQLLAVYEKRRDWEKLIALREREIAAIADLDQRASKTYEVAKLAATKLKRPDICTIWWEKVLETDPAHEEAIDELEKLYERAKAWDRLAEICSKKANMAVDAPAQIDALQKLGLLYTDKVVEPRRAIDAWRRLLEVDPEHRRAQDALKKLYVTEGAWDELEAFYRVGGKLEEYVRVLERQVEAGPEEQRLPLALKVAALYLGELDKADRAMRGYERVLTLDENNLEAAEALIPLYEAGRDPRKLLRVLEIQLGGTKEPALRQERLRRLAVFSEEKLRDKGAAYGWWLKAHEEDRESADIRTEVERLAAETGGWQELVDAYKRSINEIGASSADALPLLLVVARVQEQELGNLDDALTVNEAILEIEPASTAALDALERLYLGKQMFEQLLGVYRRKLDLSVDADERCSIQFRVGQLYEDEIKDDERAVQAYRGILDTEEDNRPALQALDRLYERNQRWHDLVEVILREISLAESDDERASLKYRLGQVREARLGDLGGAIDSYRDILAEQPHHPEARSALERHLASPEHKLEIARILEPIYEQIGEWQRLVEVHEIQLESLEEQSERFGLLMRVGELHSKRLGDAERAFDSFARAFAEDPAAESARGQLQELASLIDEGWSKLVALYRRAIDESDLDPVLLHELCTTLARSAVDRLDDSGLAVEYYRRALKIEPDDLDALNALERIFSQGERYQELLEVYRRKADIGTEPEERLANLFRIASIYEEMLQSAEDAISTYNEILANDGDNEHALRALDRLYVQGGQWQELADNLSRQLLQTEEPQARVELLVRLAQLRETRLGELAAAVETYRMVLELAPDSVEAVGALERLIGHAEHELVIAQILEPIYQATGNWERQIHVYEIMVRHAFDPERKIALLHAIAELHEVGGENLEAAFATYARAFRDDPRSPVTAAQLDRLARVLEQWQAVVELHDAVIEQVSDDELKVQLLTRLAQVHEVELGDAAAAVATYTRILDTSAGQVEAASAIQAIHERNADYPALVGILKRKSELLVDLNERKELLFKAAQIEEEVLEQAEAAVVTYNAVLHLDEADFVAMDALERLYIRMERWEPLKDVYAKKAELAEDPGDKRQMLYVLGQVYDRELGDIGKAIETYQAILDLAPDELPAIQALDRLFGVAERWYELLQNLERQVELADYPGESVALKYRIGQLWQERLQDLTRAIESYREALEIDPSHRETLAALDGLVRREEGEPVMAARVLEPIYDASGEHGKLIDVLRVMAKHAEDPDTKVALLHRIGELYEHRLEQPQQAFSAYLDALREDSSNELSLGQAERLADLTRGWSELAGLYARESEKSLDVPRQIDLLSRLARIYEEELALAGEAIAIYRRILDVEFDNRAAVFALDRLYTAGEQWSELVEILRKEIQLSESDEEILAVQFRLGQILEHNVRNLPAAIEVYRDILNADPGNAQTTAALEMLFLEGMHQLEIGAVLEPLYLASGEFEKVHKIYEVQLGKLGEPGDRQGMFNRLAELAEQQLADPHRALHWWGEALCEDPRSELAGDEAERLAQVTGAWANMVEVYGRILERYADPDVQKRALLRLGRVYEHELGDAAAAIDTFKRALDLDGKDVEALEALDRLYSTGGQFDALVKVLQRRIETTLDGDLIVELQFRRGRIFADALGNLDAALACFQQVLEQDSRNRTALEACEEIFARRDDWRRLYETYEKLVDVADGDTELAEVYARMARVASEALGDEDGAIDLWGRVLDIRGEDPQALAALEEIYGRRGMWEEIVDVITREVAAARTTAAKVELHKRLGRVWLEKLERERNALESWLRAYELDPQDMQTLRALAYLYQATQAWEPLAAIVRQIIEVGQLQGTVDEAELVELFAQLGRLEGDLLGRVNAAVDAWRQVLALDPGDFRALSALEQLFTREARWEECIDVLEKRSLVLDDPAARIDTLLQAAAIWEEKVIDVNRAAAVYERVRQLSPGNVMASQRLEAIYHAQARWDLLTEVLLERVEHTRDQMQRIATLQQVARIYEREVGDQESAFVVLQAAFREDYAYESTARELERLATAAGKWEDLLADYTHVVQGLEGESPDAACDLWVKIGRWYGDHLAHLDYAIHSVQQALRINPRHLGALGALADFQRKRGSWGELIEVLGRYAEIESEPDRKVELYLQLAELLEVQMQDQMQAIASYQAALRADGECARALTALERLYRAHEMWEPLIDVLARRAEIASDPDDAIALRLEIGQLWDQRLLDAPRAIGAFQEVLSVEPHNLRALRALEQLYEKTGQSEKYLDNLEAQLDASPTDADQVSLYERMASAWEERFGKLDRAAECLEKIVALDQRNYGVYRELVRLYRQESKWEALVDTYRRYILAVHDVAVRMDLYCAMGEVYEQELEDLGRAIEAYSDVLTFDSDEPRALDALGRLYERAQEWDRAIDAMTALIRQADGAKQVELLHRIGRINLGELGDIEAAEAQFLQALSIDPAHVPSMQSLVELYSGRGDWRKAAQMMVRAESCVSGVLDKIRLLYEAARIYLDRLGQRAKATEYFAAVMALDPEHTEAAEPLADLYFETRQWPELSPVLDLLVRRAQQQHRESQDLNELYYRTARCADELGDYEKALGFYKAAYDIDPSYLPTLTGRADLLYKMQDWDGAGRIYQTILVQHRDSQDESAVVRTYYRLGMVRLNLGERKKALNMFEKALEIDPHHAETLNAVIEIHSEQGDWDAVVHAKRGLLHGADEDGKIRLLDEIGTIYHQQLGNAQKAIGAYVDALEIRPDDHQLLQKLLDLYTETEQWKKSVEVIVRFIELEADPVRRGSYYQAAGTICRDKIKAIDEAIDYYNLALDNFFADPERIPKAMLPRALKAFADIDKILTMKRDWKAQERAYRQMIKRLKPGEKILVELWSALGEIYRSRLKQYQSAIAAYEVAQQLEPENNQRREILAELYVLAGPSHADKAVQQHMEMLRADPFKYDSYKALRRIYMDTHQYDKTWCVCNALAFLKKAEPDELQFYEQYKPRAFVKAKNRMTEEMWRKVFHPDEDPYVGAILGAIWQGAAMIRAQPHKAFNLRRKDRRPLESDQLQFSKIFLYTGQVLNVSTPDVYLEPEKPGEIAVANTHEKGQLIPSFVVRANLLQGRPEREIAFAAARWLSYMRPDHFLKLALPSNTELKTAFLSAIVMVRRNFPLTAEMQPLVAQYLPEMEKRILPAWLEQLGIVVNRFLQAAPEVNLTKWGHAVDATAQRAGFVICGDLEVAARMVSTEPVVAGGPQVKEKIKELVLYSVSEDYFAVRQHLGITIG
jgi:tetratricopeptide (TPR) repeat protein